MFAEEWLHPRLRAFHYALLLRLFGPTAFPLCVLRGLGRPGNPAAILAVAGLAPIISAVQMMIGIAAEQHEKMRKQCGLRSIEQTGFGDRQNLKAYDFLHLAINVIVVRL